MFGSHLLAAELGQRGYSNRAAAFDEMVFGSPDKGMAMLALKADGRTNAVPLLSLGAGFAYAACLGGERDQRARAVELTERAFAALDEDAAKEETSVSARAKGLYLKAYLCQQVLRDRSTAIDLAQQALVLEPGHAGAQAILDRSQSPQTEARIFGSATPLINKSYVPDAGQAKVYAPIKLQDWNGLAVEVTEAGNYRLEASADMLHWQAVWEGAVEPGRMDLGLEGDGETPARFYRVLRLHGAVK